MANIRMDLDALVSLSSSLNKKAEEFSSLNQQMDQLNQSITSSWSGSAREAYEKMTSGYYQKNQKLLMILKKFSEYARIAANTFSETDAACAAKIRDSF